MIFDYLCLPLRYLEESKRHNRALEALTEAREKFYEGEVQRKNKLQQLRQDLANANNDEVATNRALLALKKFQQSVKPLPKLSEFYEPSTEGSTTRVARQPLLGYSGVLVSPGQ